MRRFSNLVRNHRNWASYLVAKRTGSLKAGFTFHTRTGMKIKVPARMLQTYKECFLDESYTKGFPAGKIAATPEIVVDIGANVGYFSLFAMHRFPRAKVLGFEPMPQNYQLLTSYHAQFKDPRFTIHNLAVSGDGQPLLLNYDPSDSFTTDASIFNQGNSKSAMEVRSVTLQNILDIYIGEDIGLLKLDCEGSEYAILYQAPAEVFKKIKCLAVETHLGQGSTENIGSIRQFLEEKGYTTNVVGSKVYAW